MRKYSFALLLFVLLAILCAGSAFATIDKITLFPDKATSTDNGNLVYSGSRNVNFTFNVTSNMSILNCSLFTNQSGSWAKTISNITGQVLNASTSWINYTFSADGNYSWGIECWDSELLNVNYSSTNRTVVVDTVKPVVGSWAANSNISSVSNKWYPNYTLFVNFSVTEVNYNKSEIIITNSSTQIVYTVNISKSSTSSYYNFTFVAGYDNNYTVNISLRDLADNTNLTSIIIRMDMTYPALANSTGNYNNSIHTINWIYFNVTTSDTNFGNITYHLIQWNGTVYNKTTYTLASNNNINWTGLPYGAWKFNATVEDLAGNKNNTATYNTYLYAIGSEFNTTLSTNLSAVTDWSSVSLVLATNTANVTFTGLDLRASSLDFDTYAVFGTESIYIDSTNLTTGTATVYMSGLTYMQKPTILRDGAECLVCTDITYSGGVLQFTTTGFSTFTLRSNDGSGGHTTGTAGSGGVGSTGAQGYCGNGICDMTYIGENANNCPADCKPSIGNTNVYQTYGSLTTQQFNERLTPGLDTDSDGLSDYDEITYFMTSPNNPDSDNDGVTDYSEAKRETTPGKLPETELSQSTSNTSKLWLWLIPLIIIIAGVIFFVYRRKH